MWLLVGVGSQLVLEVLQCCQLAHGSLRELVLQYKGPQEKAMLLSFLKSASGESESCDLQSSASGESESCDLQSC